jgi:hypothetical protein
MRGYSQSHREGDTNQRTHNRNEANANHKNTPFSYAPRRAILAPRIPQASQYLVPARIRIVGTRREIAPHSPNDRQQSRSDR